MNIQQYNGGMSDEQDERIWDFGSDLLAAWNIEDLSEPGMVETFREMFVAAGFGDVSAERERAADLQRQLEEAENRRLRDVQSVLDQRDALRARMEAVWDEGARAAFNTEYGPADAQVELERMRHHNPYRTESKSAALVSEEPAPASDWEYGVRDYRAGVTVIGSDPLTKDRKRIYGERPLVRRRPASEWEEVSEEPAPEPPTCQRCHGDGGFRDWRDPNAFYVCDVCGGAGVPIPAPEPPKLDPVLVQLHRYMERYEDRRGATAGQRAVLDAIQSILDGGQVVWSPSDERRVQ